MEERQNDRNSSQTQLDFSLLELPRLMEGEPLNYQNSSQTRGKILEAGAKIDQTNLAPGLSLSPLSLSLNLTSLSPPFPCSLDLSFFLLSFSLNQSLSISLSLPISSLLLSCSFNCVVCLIPLQSSLPLSHISLSTSGHHQEHVYLVLSYWQPLPWIFFVNKFFVGRGKFFS
jgi:hypothetical protein